MVTSGQTDAAPARSVLEQQGATAQRPAGHAAGEAVAGYERTLMAARTGQVGLMSAVKHSPPEPGRLPLLPVPHAHRRAARRKGSASTSTAGESEAGGQAIQLFISVRERDPAHDPRVVSD